MKKANWKKSLYNTFYTTYTYATQDTNYLRNLMENFEITPIISRNILYYGF